MSKRASLSHDLSGMNQPADALRDHKSDANINSKSNPITGSPLQRIWIERVRPEVDGGKWPAKGIVGDRFAVEADLVADGHDVVTGILLFRHENKEKWHESTLEPIGNDRFRAEFVLTELGLWQYTVEVWVDEFRTWKSGLVKKLDAKQDIQLELQTGTELFAAAAERATGENQKTLQSATQMLADKRTGIDARVRVALDSRNDELIACPNRSQATRYDRVLEVRADRDKARFSTWYEIFPRSTGSGGRHGTFRDVEKRLAYIASMGFDVVYFPPVHPIGTSFRKGKNNSLQAQPSEPGSPWAIGGKDGGHLAIHPELGTVEDFRRLVISAREHDLEVALDIAFQASPDHPYVTDHPDWFKRRPDGSIQYAENPPKKYQDIYPFDFACADWEGLWRELHGVFIFWIKQGVRIFRVDNPHTKPLNFWAWCIRDIQRDYPDVIFLAEAFTRPKLMYALAKAGFTQSYTYFTWRNTSWELRAYLEELTATEVNDYFRPNFWPNTPDILPEHLQCGGRAAFVGRLVLAATMTSNYGIYGPAFELMEHVARPGSEEYLDNEKYEIKEWKLDDPNSLRPVITRINRARREQAALQSTGNLRFHRSDNEQIICYSKHTDDQANRMLMVVNLDFGHRQSGWVDLDLGWLGIGADETYQVHDLLSDARYLWRGSRNYVELHPHVMPAHVFAVRRFTGHEHGFDYFA